MACNHCDEPACMANCPVGAYQKMDNGLVVQDHSKCIGCKKCLKVGCPALFVKEGKSYIDPNQCVGCTVCAQVCPVGAISRKETK